MRSSGLPNEVTEGKSARRLLRKEGALWKPARQAEASQGLALMGNNHPPCLKGKKVGEGLLESRKLLERKQDWGYVDTVIPQPGRRSHGNKTLHHFPPGFWSPDPLHPIAKSQLEARGQENPLTAYKGQPPRAQSKVGTGEAQQRWANRDCLVQYIWRKFPLAIVFNSGGPRTEGASH